MKWLSRILSAFGVLILVALLVLFVLSRRGDAGRSQVSIVIATPPANLFPWLERGDLAKKWVSWLVETRSVSTVKYAVGAREVWIMKDPNMGDQMIPIEGTCTEYDPPLHLAVDLRSPAFHGSQRYSLTPVDSNSTRLEVVTEYEFPGWFPQLMTPLLMPSAKHKMEGDLARLKTLAEKQPAL